MRVLRVLRWVLTQLDGALSQETPTARAAAVD
jgi:hypothetical protein